MAEHSRPPATGYPAPPPGTYSNGYPPRQFNSAYPYAAPPPQQHTAYQYYSPTDARRRAFLRYFVAMVISFFVIIGTIFFIVWLVIRPRMPEFRVESVTLTNLSISNSSQHVSGDWLVRFLVTNPNKKMKISYDSIDASILYKSEFLSATRVPPFDQGTRNQTDIDASFAASDVYVDGRAASGLNADKKSGTVSFQVTLEARARFRAGWWRARRRYIQVFCGELAIAVSPANGSVNGKLSGGERECRVGL